VASQRILLLTKQLHVRPAGGRELLCKVNYDVLCQLYGEAMELFELSNGGLRGVGAHLNAFRGHIDGLNSATIKAVLRAIRERHVAHVIVDGSNLGGFVAVLKRRMPRVRVTTLFHNVEARFFWGAWRLNKTARALGVLVANMLAERKAVRFSDQLVCLSERDSQLLSRLYGRAATHISPIAIEDKNAAPLSNAGGRTRERFALFVGGAFYANQAGISWFVREVVPLIEIPLYIVGRGLEALRRELEVPGKVVVVGEVEDLAEWYRQARFVVAPIFDGSGMKTKVAEALMYGKKIVGTPEAFSGYGDVAKEAGWVCVTAQEFSAAIKTAANDERPPCDPALRQIYEERYSMAAARERFASIVSGD
jgi:polysaccharide biosynthesis protein PslH